MLKCEDVWKCQNELLLCAPICSKAVESSWCLCKLRVFKFNNQPPKSSLNCYDTPSPCQSQIIYSSENPSIHPSHASSFYFFKVFLIHFSMCSPGQAAPTGMGFPARSPDLGSTGPAHWCLSHFYLLFNPKLSTAVSTASAQKPWCPAGLCLRL